MTDWGRLTDEQIAQLETLDRIETAGGSGVDAFAAFMLHVFGAKLAPHHRAWITEILDNERVAIVAPPESAKSTVISLGLVAWWIGRFPDTTNLVVSVSDDQAGKIASAIADAIEFNPRWKDVFPTVQPDKAKGWSREGYFVLDASVDYGEWSRRVARRVHPTLSAGGVGSALVIGKRVTGLLVSDDLHDVKSRTSDSIRQGVIDFFATTISSRATASARMVTVGTRWHPKDVIAYILGTGLYKVFVHPAINEAGESYWPEQWPPDRLEQKRRELGDILFRLMYLCDAQAAEGRILKADWLKSFPYTVVKSEWERFFGIDFAQRIQHLTGGHTKSPDHFALACVVNTNPVLVVEDGIDDLLLMGDAEEAFFEYAALKKPVRTVIEMNMTGVDYYRNLLRRMNATGMRYALVPVNTTKNKGTRMAEMAPDFQFGAIKVSDEDTPFLRRFREQWVGFGQRSSKDDTLDAVYNARLAAAHLLPAPSLPVQRPALSNPMRAIERVYGRH